jgi:hypothetical protein
MEMDDSAQLVRVGQLIRWKTWGDLVNTPLMMINIGHVQDDLLHYLEIFDVTSLEDERRKVLQTGNTLIFKNAPLEEVTAYSMGEWVLDQENQQLTGIKLTVKVTSSKISTVCIVPLDPKELKMPVGASIQYLSKGAWEIFKPDRPYEFPETLQLGPVLRETRLREPRAFKTRSSTPNNPLVLIPSNEMVANNNVKTANVSDDRFLGTWRALNRASLSSQTQIVLLSAKAEYRLVGETEYKPVNYFGLRNDVRFPLSVAPSQAIDIPFEFTVDKPDVAKGRHPVGINFAHLTIHHPLRVRITFTDIEGDTISLVQEYVHRVNGVQLRKPEDIGYFFVDHVDFSMRTILTIKESTDPKRYFLGVRGSETVKVTETDLHKIVYRAEKSGITEVDMKLGENNLGYNSTIWALVDLGCRRVYGFKVLLYHGSMTPVKYSGTLGYAPCPHYGGDDLETRPIQYAQESKIVPEVVYRDPIVVIEDDTLDDDIAPVSMPEPALVDTPLAAPVAASVIASAVAPAVAPVATPVAASVAQVIPQAISPVAASVSITSSVVPAPIVPPMSTLSAAPSTPMVVRPVTPVPKTVATIEAVSSALPAGVAQQPGTAVMHPSGPFNPEIPSLPSITATALGTPSLTSSAPALVQASSPDFSAHTAMTIEMLQVKIAALEARLEASERQDALMTKILALEKKLEATTTAAPASGSPSADSRLSVLENRLASMDQKLDSMNINLRLLDGNASRLALSLEKIATTLST